MEFHIPAPPSGQYTYYPGTSEVPERSAANVHNVSYKALADVTLTPQSEGIIFAHGSRFGGHALFIKDGHADLRLQLPRHPARGPDLGARTDIGSGTSSASSSPRRGWATIERESARSSCTSTIISSPNEIRTVMGHFSLCGEGLCIGYDSADPVSALYAAPFTFTGGEIKKVVFDVADDAYVDVEAHLAAAMARD